MLKEWWQRAKGQKSNYLSVLTMIRANHHNHWSFKWALTLRQYAAPANSVNCFNCSLTCLQVSVHLQQFSPGFELIPSEIDSHISFRKTRLLREFSIRKVKIVLNKIIHKSDLYTWALCRYRVISTTRTIILIMHPSLSCSQNWQHLRFFVWQDSSPNILKTNITHSNIYSL